MILQWRMEPSTRGWMDRLAKQKAKTGSGSLPSSRLGCSCCCWWYFYFWRMARQYKIRSVQNQRPSSGKLDREATPSEASIPRLPPRRRSGGSVGGAPSCQSRLTATFHYYSPPLLYSILFPWFYFINSTRSSSSPPPPRSFISKRMATRQECLGYGGEKAKARIAKNTNTKVKSTLARVN